MVSASSANCSHIIRQCELLKTKIQGKSQEVLNSLSDESVQRQQLANLYKNILLNDLTYSLEKKVELELWNSAFKSHIDNFRSKAKDKRAEKNETQAKLSLFLDASTGFYFQLLQEFCCTYELDLPFYGKNIQLGIFKKQGTLSKKGKLNALLYICQDCLVHLGDLARYRNDIKQADSFYLLASKVLPGNGQPYNQLAILASAKGNQSLAVLNYFKSILVPNSFPAALSNLNRTLSQLLGSNGSQSQFGSTSSSIGSDEFVDLFLQWTACIFLGQDMERAMNLKERISLEFKDALLVLTQHQIVTLTSISIFNMIKYKTKLSEVDLDVNNQMLSLNLTMHMLIIEQFIDYTTVTLKNDQSNLMNQAKCLPALKILFDWIFCSQNLLESVHFQNNPILYRDLISLGNCILSTTSLKLHEKSAIPFIEDWNMHGLTYFRKIHKRYDFKIQISQLSNKEKHQIRFSRILVFLDWLVLQKNVSRFISKVEEEDVVQYKCVLPSTSAGGILEAYQAPVEMWKDIDTIQNLNIDQRTPSQSFPHKTRSLFRTNSEDSSIQLMKNLQKQQQQQPMAPYSLFNSMWSANIQQYPMPPSEVVSSNIHNTSILSTLSRVNPTNNNPAEINQGNQNAASELYHAHIPRSIGHSLEPKRLPGPPGLPNLPVNNVASVLNGENLRHSSQGSIDKDSMSLYQSFDAQTVLQSLNSVSSPIYMGQNMPMRNPLPPADTSLLRSSPMLNGFVETSQQQGVGVIGQNMRILPAVPPIQPVYPVSVSRPTLPPPPPSLGVPRDVLVDQNNLSEGQLPENQSIWSSNFAIGQGELSPLEQLLQEQRRHQRLK